MIKSELTKNKIIEVSAYLFYYNGYNNTGISKIIQKCNISKGNFYYYFKSKEDLLIEIIKYHKNNFINVFNNNITELNKPTLKKIFNIYFDELTNNEYYGGSPIGNLILEMSDNSERIRKELIIAQNQINNRLALYLQLLKKIDIEEAVELSNILMFAFEGTILKLKLEKSGNSINSFFKLIDILV